jgi:hypothetical protein
VPGELLAGGDDRCQAFAEVVLVPEFTSWAGMVLIVFLILVLLSNIYSAIRRVPFGGHLGSTVSTASICGRRAGEEWSRGGTTAAGPQMEGSRF